MQGRNSLDSLFHSFPSWVSVRGWSCVEGQGSMCAGVSKITCHHYWRPAGKQMSQARCLSSRQIHLKSKNKYRRSVSRNTVNKAPGWTAYGWQLTAGRLYTFHYWSRGRGGDSWSEPLWYNIHCNTQTYFYDFLLYLVYPFFCSTYRLILYNIKIFFFSFPTLLLHLTNAPVPK